jgi:ribosomal protein S27AE
MIVCIECLVVVSIVPATDLQKTLDEMELSLELTSEKCPHCGAVSLFPGFSRMLRYTCGECGEVVTLAES